LARPREFDDVAAVRSMTLIFWERGYQATSIHDLEDATGLTVGSLYKAFGSKREIFSKCVELYMQEQSYLAILIKNEDKPLIVALCNVMDAAIESADPANGRASGCLITNHASELTHLEPELKRIAAQQLTDVQSELLVRVRRAQANGEIADRQRPDALASFIMTVLQGLLIIAATTRDVTSMRQARDLAVEFLT
jgi:TetR/AcrR family transcriptional regulator, transcriptional repressor for nem operon